jgi:hypothetical protein
MESHCGKSDMIAATKDDVPGVAGARRERLEKRPRPMGHRFTRFVDNLCRIIRGTPDLRKQARLAYR